MNKQIAIAYSIAGLAVAGALIVVVTTSQLESTTSQTVAKSNVATSESPVQTPTTPAEQSVETDSPEVVEYVYVDEPQRRGSKKNRHDSDHDDEDNHDEDDD